MADSLPSSVCLAAFGPQAQGTLLFAGKELDAYTSLRDQGVRDTSSLLTFVPSLRVATPMSVENTLGAADFVLENAVKPAAGLVGRVLVEVSKPADKTIKDLRDQVQRLEATVAQQQETIKQMRNAYEMELNKKDEEIAKLKAEVNSLRNEVSELRKLLISRT